MGEKISKKLTYRFKNMINASSEGMKIEIYQKNKKFVKLKKNSSQETNRSKFHTKFQTHLFF